MSRCPWQVGVVLTYLASLVGILVLVGDSSLGTLAKAVAIPVGMLVALVIFAFLLSIDIEELIPTLTEVLRPNSGSIPHPGEAERPIHRVPGFRLLGFAEFFFSRDTYEGVLKPPVSDMLEEYLDALDKKRFWMARFAVVRGYWSFWSAVIKQSPLSTLWSVYKVLSGSSILTGSSESSEEDS